MKNLFGRIVFHYIGNFPSSILGIEISVEPFNNLGLGTESTA